MRQYFSSNPSYIFHWPQTKPRLYLISGTIGRLASIQIPKVICPYGTRNTMKLGWPSAHCNQLRARSTSDAYLVCYKANISCSETMLLGSCMMNIFHKHIKFTHILSISADVQGLEKNLHVSTAILMSQETSGRLKHTTKEPKKHEAGVKHWSRDILIPRWEYSHNILQQCSWKTFPECLGTHILLAV